jgi:hypothetical protein
MRIYQRVDSGSLAFLVMGHVRIVAAFDTKRTAQYLMRFHRFESIAISREYADRAAG